MACSMQVAEALAGAGVLGEDGADHRDGHGDLGAAERRGQGGGRLDEAEAPASGWRRACASACAARGRRAPSAVERRDDDGEEADQRDDHELGQRCPKPNQTTSSGATITIGTAWEATSSG